MAAAPTATITEEGDQEVVRLPREVPLKPGSVSYEVKSDGTLEWKPVENNERQRAWTEFLDALAAREPDPEFMAERPMNRLPVERNLFPDD